MLLIFGFLDDKTCETSDIWVDGVDCVEWLHNHSIRSILDIYCETFAAQL